MSAALAALTREAVALPYAERVDLLNSLAQSLYRPDSVGDEESKDARIQRRLAALEKFAGSGKNLWKDVDAVDYQRTLREERTID